MHVHVVCLYSLQGYMYAELEKNGCINFDAFGGLLQVIVSAFQLGKFQ